MHVDNLAGVHGVGIRTWIRYVAIVINEKLYFRFRAAMFVSAVAQASAANHLLKMAYMRVRD